MPTVWQMIQFTGNLSGYPGDKPDGTQWYHHNTIASVTSRKVFYDAAGEHPCMAGLDLVIQLDDSTVSPSRPIAWSIASIDATLLIESF